jgi:hypothetical protein
MSIKEFDRKFNIPINLEEEKRRFVNRIEERVFNNLMMRENYSTHSGYHEYKNLFEQVCYELGENSEKIIGPHIAVYNGIPNLKVLCDNDFLKTLRVLVAAYKVYEPYPHTQKIIDISILDALHRSNLNLGIQWSHGIFYPTGEELLDRELVEEALTSLSEFPDEQKDIKEALDNLNAQRSSGVVENCYLAMEGLARKVLKNNKTLLNNKPDLLKALGISRYWGNILSAFIEYANEYRRHAGEDRHNLKAHEVEAFLYLTCLLIRMTCNVNKSTRD